MANLHPRSALIPITSVIVFLTVLDLALLVLAQLMLVEGGFLTVFKVLRVAHLILPFMGVLELRKLTRAKAPIPRSCEPCRLSLVGMLLTCAVVSSIDMFLHDIPPVHAESTLVFAHVFGAWAFPLYWYSCQRAQIRADTATEARPAEGSTVPGVVVGTEVKTEEVVVVAYPVGERAPRAGESGSTS
mmetsp:Transcript_32856/g.76422  ORF Transcript_32856/g.76422 Transcript_32856/m.76422 type:complete len:187 (-) Transcript_32856:142-702(-)|eukprot:CAMPEP_0171095978 /NCGR_PEP_ID=MMETSP0766_2-20121228/43480_1 /TAXON_ID=439317 /ORGANISM="Gambierdiscus australes, Strain CAWD 149" /LENGTH=186 /DNA_ID=CAMNT_0011554857 /DNA_START=90 /DNA_END=650 /DNA_ORIENTATION=-